MIQRTTISILALSLVAFLGGLIGSIRAQSQGEAPKVEAAPPDLPPWGRCLGVGPDRMAEIESRDPTFRADLADLRAELADHRRQLADLFDIADSSDEDIRAAVEQIIETRTRLERRVTDYLLAVRPELTPHQQKRLFEICAEGVRGGHGKGWGWGRGGRGGGEGGWGGGRGGGRSPGGGAARGAGRGPGRGHGRGQSDGRGQRPGPDRGSGSGRDGGQGRG